MQVPVLPLRPLWHLGALHPFEQLLTVLLAFGPFLVLGIVVWRRRKADAAEERSAAVRDAGSEEPEDASRTARLD
ncbi:MAG: hypothetical protein WBQ60_05680 [Asticcacaulis sp.]